MYLPYIFDHGLWGLVKLHGDMIHRMFWTSDNSKAGTSPFSVFVWTFFPANTLYCYFDRGNLPYSLYLISNPFILWTFWPTLIYNFLAAIKRKELARLFIVSAILMLYIPWMVIDRVRYFFYLLPAMPFLVILITQTIIDLLHYQKPKVEKEVSKTQSYFETKENPDFLDKLMIKIDALSTSWQTRSNRSKLNKKLHQIINNKQTISFIIVFYILLVITIFVLYYPLLNGIPVSNGYRKAVSFFWPFLIQ